MALQHHAVGSTKNALGKGDRPTSRDTLTASGESRSQLYRRLRSEGAWELAEEFKETERARSRSAGMTKAQAGVQAWDSVAIAFPPADAVTWAAFNSRSLRPPFISQEVDLTDGIVTLAGAWYCTMKLAGCLATRCPQIKRHSRALLNAIDVRLGLEPLNGMMINEDAVRNMTHFMVSDPAEFLRQARTLFAGYESASTPYGNAVANEFAKLIDFMELLAEFVVEHWDRIRPWLFGPRQREAERFLARACKDQAKVSTPSARKAR